MTELTGRRALVTGSSRGIGAAVAEALAGAGVDLVLNARGAEDLDRQATELEEKYGVRTASVPADLADATEVSRLASEALDAFGGLDILINNAGISFPEPVTAVTVEHWDAVMDVNLRAACLLASRVGAAMAEAGSGRIINIASAAAVRALRDHYAYCVSKAGLVMATEVLALELGPRGVRANVVCPTVVMTEMGQRVWGEEEKAAPMLARIPVGHFAEPADVAAAVLYLASPAADMLNGVTLPIDGGYTIT
jgi:NAD(P)-dependent dehydrogenase (short-subunit alcohol dehydrogenase family)